MCRIWMSGKRSAKALDIRVQHTKRPHCEGQQFAVSASHLNGGLII
jgi:hypothetical protein